MVKNLVLYYIYFLFLKYIFVTTYYIAGKKWYLNVTFTKQ